MDINKIVIDVLNSLGYKDNMEEKNSIFEIMNDIDRNSKKTIIFKEYDFRKDNELKFVKENILIGDSINDFLGNPKGIYILAITLGIKIDKNIKLRTVRSISQGFLYDNCSMIYIEELLKSWEIKIKSVKKEEGLFISKRFSPGYGDLPLSVQPIILSELDASKKIGLTLTDSNILLPKKSVTAIIGIYDEKYESKYSNCDSCLIRNHCKKKERGEKCGY